jgi:hypothetical protein
MVGLQLAESQYLCGFLCAENPPGTHSANMIASSKHAVGLLSLLFQVLGTNNDRWPTQGVQAATSIWVLDVKIVPGVAQMSPGGQHVGWVIIIWLGSHRLAWWLPSGL